MAAYSSISCLEKFHGERCLVIYSLCVRAKSLQLCLTLCNPMDYSLPGSSVHETLQARILEWVAMFCSRGSSRPREQTPISYTAGRVFTTEPPGSLYLLISHLNSITPLLTVGNT